MKLLEIVNSPWAIKPDKLVEIREIYQTHLKGEKIDLKPIEAALGRPLENKPKGYEVIDGVAVIPIEGVIAKRMNLMMQISGGTSTDLFAKDFKAALADVSVNSIILAIDSPGGTVDGTADIAKLIFEARGVKPITAFTDGMMASAAYWIGSAADKVYISNNTTVVGSIGVVATHQDISKAEEKIGVKTTEIYAGKYKRIASQYAPLSDEGRASIQERVDYLYGVFVGAVAQHRNANIEQALSMADGRLFTGNQAIDAGLVDGVATLDSLIADLTAGGSRANRKEITMAEEKKEVIVITAESIEKDYPAIFEGIKKAGLEIGLAEGAKAERERIQGVFSTFRAGREKLVTEAMFDGKSTKADISVAILADEDAKKEAYKAKLDADAASIGKIPQAEPGDGEAKTIKRKEFDALNTAKRHEFLKNGGKITD